MPRKIFISYRRSSADLHAAARLYQLLAPEFDADQVFLDVRSIAPGVDISNALHGALDETGILLAVIGPGWHASVDRLHRRDDFVATELNRGLNWPDRIAIPLLVNGAAMPAAVALPKALRGLGTLNAITLHDEFFDEIVAARLLRTLHGTHRVKLTTFDEILDRIHPNHRETIAEFRSRLAGAETKAAPTPDEALGRETAPADSARLREAIREAVALACDYRRPIDQHQLGSRVYGYGPEDIEPMSDQMILDGELVEAKDGTLRLPPFRYANT